MKSMHGVLVICFAACAACSKPAAKSVPVSERPSFTQDIEGGEAMRRLPVLAKISITPGGIYLDTEGNSVLKKYNGAESGGPRSMSEIAEHLQGYALPEMVTLFLAKGVEDDPAQQAVDGLKKAGVKKVLVVWQSSALQQFGELR
jgi:hypothetical protein